MTRAGDSSHMTWTESDSHMVETSEELDPKNIDSGLVSKLDAAKAGRQMIFYQGEKLEKGERW